MNCPKCNSASAYRFVERKVRIPNSKAYAPRSQAKRCGRCGYEERGIEGDEKP